MKNYKIRKWTSKEKQFLIDHISMKDEKVAQELNRSIYSIRNKRIRLGINKKYLSKYSLNLDFFKSWSNEMAYILGYIFADGYIRIRKSGMELTIKSIDFGILNKMNKAMESSYPISKDKTDTGSIFRLSIYRKEIIEDLLNLDLTPQKSLTMTFPKIPHKFIFHFIRGYFDGDGHVRIVGNSLDISFTSGSLAFLVGLKQELEKLSIKSGIYSPKNYSFHILTIYKKNQKYFIDNLYYQASLILQRKKDIFQEYFQNHYYLTIKCIDCGKEVKKTGRNQKRCKYCAIENQREANRISYMKRSLKDS